MERVDPLKRGKGRPTHGIEGTSDLGLYAVRGWQRLESIDQGNLQGMMMDRTRDVDG